MTGARLTEPGREWRDRAIEAEGMVDTLGAMRERAEAIAARLQDDNDRWAQLCDVHYFEAQRWREMAHAVTRQRDEALTMLADAVTE